MTFTQAGEAIETVFWLGLGVELGVYPLEPTQRLLSLSRSFVSDLDRGINDRLELVMPEIQRLELAELLARGQVDGFPDRIAPERGLLPYFSNAVHLSHRMNRDLLGAAFREFLMFSSERQWSDMLQSSLSVDVVNDLVLHRPTTLKLSLESLVAGFFSTVKDMIPWSGLFTTLDEDDSIIGSRSTLMRRLGRITCWSLDFNLGAPNERFLGIAAIGAAAIREMSTFMGPNLAVDTEAFKTAIGALAEGWKGFHPKFLIMAA